jgi:hypothetical protein
MTNTSQGLIYNELKIKWLWVRAFKGKTPQTYKVSAAKREVNKQVGVVGLQQNCELSKLTNWTLINTSETQKSHVSNLIHASPTLNKKTAQKLAIIGHRSSPKSHWLHNIFMTILAAVWHGIYVWSCHTDLARIGRCTFACVWFLAGTLIVFWVFCRNLKSRMSQPFLIVANIMPWGELVLPRRFFKLFLQNQRNKTGAGQAESHNQCACSLSMSGKQELATCIFCSQAALLFKAGCWTLLRVPWRLLSWRNKMQDLKFLGGAAHHKNAAAAGSTLHQESSCLAQNVESQTTLMISSLTGQDGLTYGVGRKGFIVWIWREALFVSTLQRESCFQFSLEAVLCQAHRSEVGGEGDILLECEWLVYCWTWKIAIIASLSGKITFVNKCCFNAATGA